MDMHKRAFFPFLHCLLLKMQETATAHGWWAFWLLRENAGAGVKGSSETVPPLVDHFVFLVVSVVVNKIWTLV